MKLTLLITACFLSASALADWSNIDSKDFTLGPPPALGSPASTQDFLTLHELQDSRTVADCQEAKLMESANVQDMYTKDSNILSPSQMKDSKKIVDKATKLGDRVSSYFKDKYKRPRPFSTDPTLKPCITRPSGSKAYPSGHAMYGAVSACVLAIIYPKQASELEAFGEHFGELRVIGGVHHPTDVSASQDLALQICDRLGHEPDFLKDVRAIQK